MNRNLVPGFYIEPHDDVCNPLISLMYDKLFQARFMLAAELDIFVDGQQRSLRKVAVQHKPPFEISPVGSRRHECRLRGFAEAENKRKQRKSKYVLHENLSLTDFRESLTRLVDTVLSQFAEEGAARHPKHSGRLRFVAARSSQCLLQCLAFCEFVEIVAAKSYSAGGNGFWF